MSIRSEINARCGEQRLVLHEPAVMGTAVVRTMFISPEISKLFQGPWADQEWADRCNDLRADLDAFVSGGLIAVAAVPRRAKTAFMSQLEPPRQRVWDLRARKPSPGIRVLGAFAEQDVFIALTWSLRKDLGEYGSEQWEHAIEICKAEWRKLFQSYQPMSDGQPISEANIHDYISSNTLLV